MWTEFCNVTDSHWPVVALDVHRHWFPGGQIAFDAVGALLYVHTDFQWDSFIDFDTVAGLVICGHTFPVRLLPLVLRLNCYMWTLISIEINFYWCCGSPCYVWTQLSIENDSRWPLVVVVICGKWYAVRQSRWPLLPFVIRGHWIPVRLIAVDLCLPLMYLHTNFQWEWYPLMLLVSMLNVDTDFQWDW